MMSIKLFSTGGTIAKRYDELSGELLFDKEHIQKMLSQGRCTAKIEAVPLMIKDSLEMNEHDRDIIFKACKETTKEKIIITHGTDTMVESAKILSTIKDKTIVFTGAMIPYAFKNSDALFNISAAITAVQILPAGIYICMNGKVFSWENVTKNKKKGIFEKLS
jgi:L-asparaginase